MDNFIENLLSPISEKQINDACRNIAHKAMLLSNSNFESLKNSQNLGSGKHHYCLVYNRVNSFLLVARGYKKEFNFNVQSKASLLHALNLAKAIALARFRDETNKDAFGFFFC